MPSSYTPNLGIVLPADGELDGIWGDVVNNNMSILDRATNGSLSLDLAGTSSILTTGEGSESGVDTYGQYKALILGGTPSGTHTITIAPNDAQKIYYVYNLSGQSAVFAQGSGTTVTIANNDSAIIYCNGAGSIAGVFNLTDHLAMSSVRITGGVITGITDLALADGGTGASNAADARTNLGLGTIATQSAGAVTITGGTITGITDLAIADGGTGASSAAQALVNFGLTATAAEINILDGVTASTAEINILDGVTASTAEINILDGVTASTAEINYLDITTLGTSQASKVLTADSGGKVLVNGAQRSNIVAVAALDIDCSAGNYFTKTISANSTFTFSNAPSSSAYAFTLELTHNSGTVSWPASVTWPLDAPPVLITGKTHLIVFVTDDGGTRWRGAALVGYTN